MRRTVPKARATAKSYFVAGDSAGGCLTLTTLIGLRDTGDRLPDAAVKLSPLTDFTFSGESIVTRRDTDPMTGDKNGNAMPWMREMYLGDHDPKAPLASPLLGISPGCRHC